MAADLQDEASARALAVTAAQLGGGQVDILVNSAGLFPFGPTDQMTEADFDDVFTVNVKVPFYLVAGMGLYGASKAALVLLTKSWAAEFGPSGVRVSAVSPGPTRTEGTAGMGEALDQLAAGSPSDPGAQAPAILDLPARSTSTRGSACRQRSSLRRFRISRSSIRRSRAARPPHLEPLDRHVPHQAPRQRWRRRRPRSTFVTSIPSSGDGRSVGFTGRR